jgi:hypothetical protein
MDDFFKVSKLVELLLYGAAAAYLGHQFGKPPEARHWHRIKRRLKRRSDKSLDVCNRPDNDTDLTNLG